LTHTFKHLWPEVLESLVTDGTAPLKPDIESVGSAEIGYKDNLTAIIPWAVKTKSRFSLACAETLRID
jgi:hypothetical protein